VMLAVSVTTFWASPWPTCLDLPDWGEPGGGTPSGCGIQRLSLDWTPVLPFIPGAADPFWCCLFRFGACGLRREGHIAASCVLQRYAAMAVPLARAACTGVLIGLVDALLPTDFINRAGIRRLVVEGDVYISRALATLWCCSSLSVCRRPRYPPRLFAPMLTLAVALGLAPPLDRSIGRSPQLPWCFRHGAFTGLRATTPMRPCSSPSPSPRSV